MTKTINLGDKEITISNNLLWTMIYRDQFGRDIIPVLMPMAAALVDIFKGIITETDKTDNIEVRDIIKAVDSDYLMDALIHISGLEFVEFINITWALAKASDSSIPEPKKWIQEFEEFPIDIIGPEVIKFVARGVVSSKNLERILKNLPDQNPPSI